MKSAQENTTRLAWAVLAQTPTGRSEVIRITADCGEADQAVQENPLLFKSGPFVLGPELFAQA
jgi:hypothetical protein